MILQETQVRDWGTAKSSEISVTEEYVYCVLHWICIICSQMPYKAITLLLRHINIFDQTEAPASTGSRFCSVNLCKTYLTSLFVMPNISLRLWHPRERLSSNHSLRASCWLSHQQGWCQACWGLVSLLCSFWWEHLVHWAKTPHFSACEPPASANCCLRTGFTFSFNFVWRVNVLSEKKKPKQNQPLLHPFLFIHTCNFNDLQKQNRWDLTIKILCA